MLADGRWRYARQQSTHSRRAQRAFRAQVQRLVQQWKQHRMFASWDGTRQLQIAQIIDEAEGIRSFYLVDPHGRPLPRFVPGQFLACHLPVSPEGPPLVRCYSLSDRPGQDHYRLTVKREDPPPGAVSGSRWMHQHLKVGDRLSVSAPRGSFCLAAVPRRPIVMVAGGIGVTPLLSMLLDLVHAQDDRQIYFFFSVRDPQRYPFRQPLERIQQACPNVHLYVSYSQPSGREGELTEGCFTGRITAGRMLPHLPPEACDYYLCGPTALIQTMRHGLQRRGIHEEQVHYESFGGKIAKSAGECTIPPPIKECDVHCDRSDHRLAWRAADGSLLDFLEEKEVPIVAGCREGSCGMCVTRVLEGRVTVQQPKDCEIPEDHCLPCVSVPATKTLRLEL